MEGLLKWCGVLAIPIPLENVAQVASYVFGALGFVGFAKYQADAGSVREVVATPVGGADVSHSVGDHIFVVVHPTKGNLLLA